MVIPLVVVRLPLYFALSCEHMSNLTQWMGVDAQRENRRNARHLSTPRRRAGTCRTPGTPHAARRTPQRRSVPDVNVMTLTSAGSR